MNWLEPFEHAFMLRAFGVGVAVAATCGVLSCLLVLRGWALMGDAVAHAVLLGIVLAYLAGAPLAAGAFAAGLACTTATGWIKRVSRIKEDTALGVVFTGLFGLGLVMFAKVPTELHLDHVLFGSLLGIEDEALRRVLGMAGGVWVVTLAARRTLLLAAFDLAQARALGLPLRWIDAGFLGLLALAIVSALEAVGLLLAVAMLVTPGATAFLLTRRFDRMVVTAMAVASGSTIVGVYGSYFFEGAHTAASVVLVQAIVFVAAFLFAPGQGLLWRAARASHPA